MRICIPSIRRPHRSHVMLIAACVLIAAALSVHPASAQGGSTHTVQSGENLFRIALRYNMSVDYLAAANNITDPSRVFAGQVLIIPDPNVPLALPVAVPVESAPVEAVPVAVDPAVNVAPVFHTVQAGETLAQIARAYGVSWPDLAAANAIVNPNAIYSGQQLIIPAPGTSSVTQLANVSPAPVNNPSPAPVFTGTERTHTVAAGEHLAAIARAYGLSWPTVARANGITNPNTIYAGQVLIIPAQDDGQGGFSAADAPPPAPAQPTITTGKQIVVDISDQRVYAYENGVLVRNVLVSTGIWPFNTVLGDFSVYLKYDSQTMSGPGYFLPGVPWVMYFYQSYSLHGTYWHNNFGTPMSHGCVNMPTPEAEWLYHWAEMGTPVHVQA